MRSTDDVSEHMYMLNENFTTTFFVVVVPFTDFIPKESSGITVFTR